MSGERSEIRVCPWCGSYYADQSHCQRDGQQLVASDGVVDRYRIVERIGEGGMGAVYRAEHTMIEDRIVAIKLLHREHVRDQALVKRFFREAKAASSVANEHIVQVIDFGITDQAETFLVMEYVKGRGLRDVIDDEAPLTLERSFSIGVQIAEGLYAAHRRGIVHRDLKPENVLVADEIDGQREFVKLLDFGIAQLSEYRDARITRAGMILGTPAYMSPEQASGEPVDERADIYALGTILYEMLVGHCPFEAGTAKDVLIAQLTQLPVPPRQLRPDMPTSIERVILRALNKEPQQRPKTMMYLAYELRDALTRQTGGVPALDLDDEQGEAADHTDELIAGGPLLDRIRQIRSRVSARQLLLFGGVLAGMALGVVVTLLVVGSGADPGEVADRGDGGASAAMDIRAADARAATAPVDRAADAKPDPDPAAPRRVHKGSRRQRPRPRQDRIARHSPRVPGPAAQKTSHQVRVTSIPAGAKVYDAKELLGRTPLSVSTADERTVNVFSEGYADKVLHLKKHQTGKVVARLVKQVASWDVLSLRQLKKMRDSGQISRYTYERRKAQLTSKRDEKLMKLRVEFKMGHWTSEQYERQARAIRESYQ